MASLEQTSLKAWELDNNVQLVDPQRDALYNYDDQKQSAAASGGPWKENPNHFKHVRISAVALIKMAMHARSGGAYEIMGLMLGAIDGDTFIVTDAFRLPVEGTETRVNAHAEAQEYMVDYITLSRDQGRKENVIGWYHSHPGYGCWLSGIDVDTQFMQQEYQDPFLAVVVDPERTINSGKVDIGAFRTYPKNYKPDDQAGSDGFQAIPLDKAAEFGAHANRYYPLEVSHFKSSLDAHLVELLWHKYWVQTLGQSPLLTNRDFGNKQMLDLGSKLREATTQIQRQRGSSLVLGSGVESRDSFDQFVEKLAISSSDVASKEKSGLAATQIKAKLFNGLGSGTQLPKEDAQATQ